MQKKFSRLLMNTLENSIFVQHSLFLSGGMLLQCNMGSTAIASECLKLRNYNHTAWVHDAFPEYRVIQETKKGMMIVNGDPENTLCIHKPTTFDIIHCRITHTNTFQEKRSRRLLERLWLLLKPMGTIIIQCPDSLFLQTFAMKKGIRITIYKNEECESTFSTLKKPLTIDYSTTDTVCLLTPDNPVLINDGLLQYALDNRYTVGLIRDDAYNTEYCNRNGIPFRVYDYPSDIKESVVFVQPSALVLPIKHTVLSVNPTPLLEVNQECILLRNQMKIPLEATVIGRFGLVGFDGTPYIPVIQKHPSVVFVFVNTKPFCNEKNVVYTTLFVDTITKASFYSMCQAFILGETDTMPFVEERPCFRTVDTLGSFLDGRS